MTRPLSERMLLAGDVVEEVSKTYDYMNPAEALWSAAHLRYESKFVAEAAA
jgi:hypothetical protein